MTPNAYLADNLGEWLISSGMSTVAVTVIALAFVIMVTIIATYFLTRAI